MKLISLTSIIVLLLFGCKNSQTDSSLISQLDVEQTIAEMQTKFGSDVPTPIDKAVKHTASLWRSTDGDAAAFKNFCVSNFIGTADEKTAVFLKLEHYFETLMGNYTRITLGLNENLALDNGPLHEIDKMFGAYSPNAHLKDDFFENKIAFVVALNFPYFSLNEKEANASTWTDEEWAWARMGDTFVARVPAELNQEYNQVSTDADIYISAYNIYMGSLRTNNNEQIFPNDMVLLTHWNLRDEIKSNYSNSDKGIEKQLMVYEVMKRIIDQTIPKSVINSGTNQWNPFTNKLFNNETEISFEPEQTDRYQQIINSFKALRAQDVYYPQMNTFIKRNFEGSMEMEQEAVEALFDAFLSSPEVAEVAALIKNRLGRDLQPYDIWYDGFKARSSLDAEMLDRQTQSKYPTAKDFEADMARMLSDLGWEKDCAQFLASKITVEPARGSGHALGAEIKDMDSYLRTRLPESGMNYKGYNIAVHEFGHNVEQTISLHSVPFYAMHGVPNTSFTEALAFIFQSRDLQLLGIADPNLDKQHLKTLDTFWSLYEIMGVSMVDMKVWKWLYENPEATAEQLKVAVIAIANEVWNTYYAPVFGMKDEPILAIYSHMIAYPLYLSAYSFGHLIDFQLEQYLVGKDFAAEVERIYSLGRVTPQAWMVEATGKEISNDPILRATNEAVSYFKNK